MENFKRSGVNMPSYIDEKMGPKFNFERSEFKPLRVTSDFGTLTNVFIITTRVIGANGGLIKIQHKDRKVPSKIHMLFALKIGEKLN